MKVTAPAEPPDWTPILELVEKTLVGLGMDSAEAGQRLTLWRARQHQLEGQALEALLPGMDEAEQAQQLLRWALEGHAIDDDLLAGAAALGLALDPDPPFS